ncbi:MAG TPA: phosphoribosylformylglycinamidine cyclo-ligase [bacterium]
MLAKASLSYRRSGVDVVGADAWLDGMRRVIASTAVPGVLPSGGRFAGLFRFDARRWADPVLVASTDGVGTKLLLARKSAEHRAIGIDAVAMNTNDVLAYGARPLFFLDYLAVGKIARPLLTALLGGVVEGCRQSGCALLGGETAEMPGVYERGEFDIAGFCVGAVPRGRLLDGSRVAVGDAVIGLASSGVHANGFSLVRKALGPAGLARHRRELMSPTRIYVKPVLAALSRLPVTAITHVTGGGLARRLPSLTARRPMLAVHVIPGSWTTPPVFKRIQAAGGVADAEMARTFNMGIGMALACRPRAAGALREHFARAGIRAWRIGTVVKKS